MQEEIIQIEFEEYNEKKENLLTKAEGIYVELNKTFDTGQLNSCVVDGYMENYDRIKIILDKYIQLLKKDADLMNLTKESFEEMERRNAELIEKNKPN